MRKDMDLERIGSRQREKSQVFAEESEALDQIAKEVRSKEAEARLAARRQARYEARNIRMKELEKKAKEDENQLISIPNGTTPDGVTRRARETRSFNSRRSSTDSSEDLVPNNLRELKTDLRELEDKFKKAMVANASLDNEKCQLMFQVDLLKDQVEEVEEQSSLILKELRAKTHDFQLLTRDHAESTRSVQLLQSALEEQQSMLVERGLVLLGGGEGEEDEEVGEDEQERRTRAIVSQETANILSGLGPGPLDVRIKRLARERDDLQDMNRRLKLDLEEEKNLSSSARGANAQQEIERETKKILDEYKFKISKSEQENATLQATVARLESQVVRFKTASETAELSEESLKAERRKNQRELRDLQTKNEELETANKHLDKRLEKLKTAKSNLLQQL